MYISRRTIVSIGPGLDRTESFSVHAKRLITSPQCNLSAAGVIRFRDFVGTPGSR